MKALAALALIAGVAGGYLGTRRLLASDDVADRLPEQVRPVASGVRARLLLARQRAGTVVEEFERGRASAERELMRDYHERVGRPLPADAPPSPPAGT